MKSEDQQTMEINKPCHEACAFITSFKAFAKVCFRSTTFFSRISTSLLLSCIAILTSILSDSFHFVALWPWSLLFHHTACQELEWRYSALILTSILSDLFHFGTQFSVLNTPIYSKGNVQVINPCIPAASSSYLTVHCISMVVQSDFEVKLYVPTTFGLFIQFPIL